MILFAFRALAHACAYNKRFNSKKSDPSDPDSQFLLWVGWVGWVAYFWHKTSLVEMDNG